jgi:di/tricarboxylate transporter
MAAIEPTLHMWVTLAFIALALVVYATERLAIEVSSLGILGALMAFFALFPMPPGGAARHPLDAAALLAGFANPGLITIAGLLIVGQGILQTGVLDRVARFAERAGRGVGWLSIAIALGLVMLASAFVNNTPLVVIGIPIMQALAAHLGRPASHLLIPLSYAAILGGRLTLIGSSVNLLVASVLLDLTGRQLGFFEITAPGLVIALVGFAYLLLAVPRLLPARASMADALVEGGGKQFLAQLAVTPASRMVGTAPVGGFFPALPDLTVHMVQRAEHAILPPFEDMRIEAGDVLVVAATRKGLTDALRADPGLSGGDGDDSDQGAPRTQALVEAMVTPNSRFEGMTLEQIGLRRHFDCMALGIQRRSRMLRRRLTDLRLEAGDVLLLQGPRSAIRGLRGDSDILLMEWSATDLPATHHGRRAVAIFVGVVLAASTGVVPTVVAALLGALAMLVSGVLTLDQAVRAVDRRIVLMLAATLALGTALKETGGAVYLASAVLTALDGAGPALVHAALFLVIAAATNVLSNNACAVLFTPIAVGIAGKLGADPTVFAIAVIFASSCSFATPIGYQTNLLVMGPGHYRFVDFVRAGLPLTVLVWLVYSLFAAWHYGLR